MKANNKLRNYTRKISKNPTKFLVIAIATLFVIFSLLQIERIANQGTFFGYQVRDISKSTEQAKENQAKSGSIKMDTSKLPDGSNNEACKIVSLEEVKSVRSVDFKQSSGLTPDTKEPLVSTCIYSYKGENGEFEMISILLRGKENEESAQKSLASLKQKGSGEDVGGLEDGAYFNNNSNQLTVRKGSQIITITHSSSSKDLDTKSITSKLGKQL